MTSYVLYQPHLILTPLNSNVESTNSERKPSMGYDLNMCAMLTVYYWGMGALDFRFVEKCFGIPGGINWGRTTNINSQELHQTILKLCKTIISESLLKEIAETIKEVLGYKYSRVMIDKYVNAFEMGNYDELPE